MIQLSLPNTNYSRIFEDESLVLRNVLNGNLIESHHVGSTAVDSLLAKPIIDVIAIANDSKKSINMLIEIDYTYKGELNIHYRLYFSKYLNTSAVDKIRLHLYQIGLNNGEISLNLAFRNYLRANEYAKSEYAMLKMELINCPKSSQKHQSDTTKIGFSNYTLRKNSFIKKILRCAKFNEVRLVYCMHHDERDACFDVFGPENNGHSYFIYWSGYRSCMRVLNFSK